MTWLKKVLLCLLLGLALVLGVWFSAENSQPVRLLLLGFAVPELSLGLLLSGVLVVGVILGFVISLLPVLRLKNENLSLKRKLLRRDKELQRLRKAPLKG